MSNEYSPLSLKCIIRQKMKFLIFALLVVLSVTMAQAGLLGGHGAVLTAPVAVAHPAVLGHGTVIGHGHGAVGLGHGAIW